MFYRIKIDLAYPADTNPKAILAHTKGLMPGALIINPGQDNEERGYIVLEHCFHDEQPNKPCIVVENWHVPG